MGQRPDDLQGHGHGPHWLACPEARPGLADRAFRLGDAYVRMGARPTFTHVPYRTEPPELGAQIACSESNAIAVAISDCGARTNR